MTDSKAVKVATVISIFLIITLLFVVFAGGSEDEVENSDNETVEGVSNNDNTSNTEEEKDTYTLNEIAEHNSGNDCWLAIDGGVYDVTNFVNQHPGGDAIIQGCGKDATQLFETQGGEGEHPNSARNLLETFKIGELETE